jgi:hypothetical protein
MDYVRFTISFNAPTPGLLAWRCFCVGREAAPMPPLA